LETALSVSQKLHATKVGFAAVWLRHAPAPLLWNHPAAKKHVLMPGRHSDLLFCLQGIPSVGTCPPIGMDSETFRRLETVRKC